MSFVFVENSTIDRNTRRKIRSHVMQGKNAGRTIHRASRVKGHSPPRPPKAEDQVAPKHCPGDPGIYTSMVENPQKMLGHVYSGQLLPATLSWENRKTIHQFITIVTNGTYTNQNDYSNPFEPKHSLWMKFFGWVWDEALFHCTLCMMEASSDFFLERRQPSQSSLKHVSQAIQLVNRSLSGKEALSNKTLYIVLALTLYEQLRDDDRKWKIHLCGLYKLIDLRGGLANLIQCEGMVEKTCRLDITFALATGSATHFRLSDIPFITKHTICSDYDKTTINSPTLEAFPNIHPELHNIYIDTMALADTVNSSHTRRIDSHKFTASLITLNYRLIEICSLQICVFNNTIDEGIHLGLTSFMLTLTLQFGRRRLLSQDFLTRRLRGFFQSKLEEIANEHTLLLWLLFIAHSSIFGKDDGWWLHPLIAREIQYLEIADWEGLHTQLSQYPWVDDLHNEAAERVWDQVFRARSKEYSNSAGYSTRYLIDENPISI